MRHLLYIALFIVAAPWGARGQSDTALSLQDAGYAQRIEKKITTYHGRLTGRTEKALVRLSRWEDRIRKILEKSSPATAQKLFGEGQPTFGRLLQQMRAGEVQIHQYQRRYDGYRDTLSATLRYLAAGAEPGGKAAQAMNDTQRQAAALDSTVARTDDIQNFIRQRRKLLMQETIRYAGSSRAIEKISKESYYYGASLQNYKEIFSDAGRREQFVKKTLSGLPAFQQFMREHSALASLFAIPQNGVVNGGTSLQSLAGLQTRASVQDMIQSRLTAGGPNGLAQVQQNLSEARAKLSSLKDKITRFGDSDVEMPDFKPNGQKSKTLWQRLEYRFDVQFARGSSYLPSTTDIGIGIGYRLNDRSAIGAGLSYKLGLGSIERIRLTHEGIGLRSYLDWKIKGQWSAAGGYELNYMQAFKNIAGLRDVAWQRSGLIGISRQYQAGKKLKGEVKVLWDFLAAREAPGRTPLVLRMGYKF